MKEFRLCMDRLRGFFLVYGQMVLPNRNRLRIGGEWCFVRPFGLSVALQSCKY